MPSDGGYDKGWCDNCVHRGCSCNIDPETGVESVDEKGRLYPCCEYDYNKNGFDLGEDKYEIVKTIKEIRERLKIR